MNFLTSVIQILCFEDTIYVHSFIYIIHLFICIEMKLFEVFEDCKDLLEKIEHCVCVCVRVRA